MPSPTVGKTAVRPVRDISQPVATEPQLTAPDSGINSRPLCAGEAPVTAYM
jgi:hypothetical protein